MIKLNSSLLNKEFYLSEKLEKPINNLPVFTHAEISLLKKIKAQLTKEIMQKIYDWKLATHAELTELELKAKIKEMYQLSMDSHLNNIRNILK